MCGTSPPHLSGRRRAAPLDAPDGSLGRVLFEAAGRGAASVRRDPGDREEHAEADEVDEELWLLQLGLSCTVAEAEADAESGWSRSAHIFCTRSDQDRSRLRRDRNRSAVRRVSAAVRNQ